MGPLTANRTENFALNVDLRQMYSPGLYNSLDYRKRSTRRASRPVGRTINNVGTLGWSFNNRSDAVNLTGGTGNFAIADSDDAGQGVSMNTELRTPVMNLSA